MLHKELGEAHPVSSYCTSALGLARHKRGDLQAAETLYSDALAHQVRSRPSLPSVLAGLVGAEHV